MLRAQRRAGTGHSRGRHDIARGPRPPVGTPRAPRPDMSAGSTAAAGAAAASAAALGADALRALPFPPHAPLAGHEAGSFARATVSERLPAILDTVLADLDRLGREPAMAAAAADVEAARAGVRQLQADMRASAALPALSAPAAGGALLARVVAWTNACLDAWDGRAAARTWLDLPWLVVECYLYARLACVVAAQPALAAAAYDPFAEQKAAAFRNSLASVGEVAAAALPLVEGAAALGPDGAREGLYQAFQYALWGNKTDLSLLVDAAKVGADGGASLAKQAAAGGGRGAGGSQYLIVDEFDAVWRCLRAPGPAGGGAGGDGAVVDLVLDNSGMELYTDLVLADFLLASGLATRVRLHGKSLPWFVSDVMRADLDAMLRWTTAAAPPAAAGAAVGADEWAAVRALGGRWAAHLASGRWEYGQHEFWTTPLPFWWMERAAPGLYRSLAGARLVVFKGDLNYRKLAYDCRWPHTEPFEAALGPFRPAPVVTLRTLKADVVAGLAPGQAEALAAVDAGWLVNGKFGVIQFAPAAE